MEPSSDDLQYFRHRCYYWYSAFMGYKPFVSQDPGEKVVQGAQEVSGNLQRVYAVGDKI